MGGAGRKIKEIASNAKPIQALRDPKTFLNKQFNPSGGPRAPGVPDAPQFDAARDQALKAALISRLRGDIRRGEGRQATIATSRAGVTKRAPTFKRKLAGV